MDLDKVIKHFEHDKSLYSVWWLFIQKYSTVDNSFSFVFFSIFFSYVKILLAVHHFTSYFFYLLCGLSMFILPRNILFLTALTRLSLHIQIMWSSNYRLLFLVHVVICKRLHRSLIFSFWIISLLVLFTIF